MFQLISILEGAFRIQLELACQRNLTGRLVILVLSYSALSMQAQLDQCVTSVIQ